MSELHVGAVREAAEPWLYVHRHNPSAAAALVCFPYAGGGASIFRDWSAALPQLELVAVQPPGRETRFRETALDSARAIAAPVAEALAASFAKPVALYGHSLGALVAFETARALEERWLRQPEAVFVSGCRAPHLPSVTRTFDLPRESLVEHLRAIGGTAPQVLASNELLDLMLPMLRGDLAAAEAYTYTPGEPLSAPIVACCGREDILAPPSQALEWERHTCAGFSLHLFAGGHFFLDSSRSELLTLLQVELARIMGRCP
jgi:medium-chain acyl-[acyl-carrier-protein] hydrolase